MKVLVCGGRNYNDTAQFCDIMDAYHKKYKFSLIIQGGAQGADFMAKMWAVDNSVEHKQFGADWVKHGKSAGAIRNKQMLDKGKPDLVIAFPGGRGTANMIRQAKQNKVEVLEIYPSCGT